MVCRVPQKTILTLQTIFVEADSFTHQLDTIGALAEVTSRCRDARRHCTLGLARPDQVGGAVRFVEEVAATRSVSPPRPAICRRIRRGDGTAMTVGVTTTTQAD